jgi:hypothetical protein
MGFCGRHQLRQCLPRCQWQPDPNADCYSNADRDSDSQSYADTDSFADSDRDANSNFQAFSTNALAYRS